LQGAASTIQGTDAPVTKEELLSKLPYPEIGFDEIAKQAWDRVCNVLYERGTLQDVNYATLEGFCSAYSRAKRADMALLTGFEEEVPMIVGRGDHTTTIMVKRKKVEIGIVDKAWNQVKMFAVQLGISISTGEQPLNKEEALSPMERAIQEAERGHV
jgi:phage terminase small subunit